MESKKVHLEGVGEILLERSRRAKHINLSVKPFKGIRVAVPRGVSFQEALGVARKKGPWLAKHLARMALVEKAVLSREAAPAVSPKAVRTILVRRLEELADRYGFTYNRVFIRNQKTRWGSCSSKNNINLNAKLVQIPRPLMDYTIMHELVHTRIKDHGPRFWEELSKYIRNPKELDRQLNAHWMLLVGVDD